MKLFLFAIIALILIALGLYNIADASNENNTKAMNYMLSNWLTTWQANKVIELSKTTANPDHYIKWFTAIQAHEQGATFVDGKTKYLAGRLKKWMEYKDFNTQLQWRTDTYNKYWHKNNTASDWIHKSRYCVSDTHWWGKGCPNWVRNVPIIASKYDAPIVTHDIWELKLKKKHCRSIVIKVDKWEYLELSFAGKVRQTIKELWFNDIIRICRDLS